MTTHVSEFSDFFLYPYKVWLGLGHIRMQHPALSLCFPHSGSMDTAMAAGSSTPPSPKVQSQQVKGLSPQYLLSSLQLNHWDGL